MEPLTWTGALGTLLNPLFALAVLGLILTVAGYLLVSAYENVQAAFSTTTSGAVTMSAPHSESLARFILPTAVATLGLGMIYLLAGIVTPY